MKFERKRVWITGASSGIGAALAHEFSLEGAELILSGRRVDALKDLANRLCTEPKILPFEATELDSLPSVVEQAWRWNEGVDLLINSAGVSQRSLAVDTSLDVYRKIMEVDFFAPVALTQLLLPLMIQRGSGHIAIVSSLSGKFGMPLRTGYAAAKHALMGFFDSLRAEVELAYGIKVTTVLPGSVRTQIAANALLGDGSVGDPPVVPEALDPAMVARTIIEGLQRGQREMVLANPVQTAMVQRRIEDPEGLFAQLAKEGARLAELRGEFVRRHLLDWHQSSVTLNRG